MARPTEQLKRQWVRNADSGQLGTLVEKDGKVFVELDRVTASKAHNLIPYRPKEWLRDDPPPPLTVNDVARIQFVADVELCRSLGLHLLADRKWQNLTDEKRIEWVNRGPSARLHPARARLWAAIKIALEGLTGATL